MRCAFAPVVAEVESKGVDSMVLILNESMQSCGVIRSRPQRDHPTTLHALCFNSTPLPLFIDSRRISNCSDHWR